MTLEVEGFDSSLDAVEWVVRFVLSFLPLLGMEGCKYWFDLRFSKSRLDVPPNFFLSLERSSLTGEGLMSSFEGGSTRGCSKVDWGLMSSVSSLSRFAFKHASSQRDRDTFDQWNWSQSLPAISEDLMLSLLGSSSKSWYLKWWSMSDSFSSRW